MSRRKISIVEGFSSSEEHRCGYCKSRSSLNHSMWAHSISETEYQNLIDRGWRRSGMYLYKPLMRRTCCPLYTIRCDVSEARLTKSHKKVLKKFNNYIRCGDTPRKNRQTGAPSDASSMEDYESADELPPHLALVQSQPAVIDYDKIEVDEPPSKEGIMSKEVITSRMEVEGSQSVPGNESKRNSTINKEEVKQLHGKKFSHAVSAAGPSSEEQGQNAAGTLEDHPKPKKAKLIRLENKYNKLIKRGMSHEDASQLTYANKNSVKQTSSFDYDSYFPCEEEMSSFALRFKTELVSVSDLKMDEVLLHKTHKLYEKYQMAVHDDSPEDCTIKQLTRFLIDSPIYDSQPGEGPPCGFGSFHEQYWIGDRLIAVGVIDILPKCISSVYFFYDPDLRSLTLGTYGCLREIFSTRSLMKVYPPIKYYYLGFYLHTCPKMAYKGKYVPSYLLCPETFTWHPIEKCRPMLDKSKYSRFETDLRMENALKCEVNLEKVGILYKRQLMSYHTYKKINYAANDEGKVKEYARLVGKDTYHNLFLYRD